MATGYTPNNKRRPPCYGCQNCIMVSDHVHTSWVCKGTQKGRELYSVLKHTREYSQNKERIEQNLRYRVMKNQRPKWCPEEQSKRSEIKMRFIVDEVPTSMFKCALIDSPMGAHCKISGSVCDLWSSKGKCHQLVSYRDFMRECEKQCAAQMEAHAHDT